MSGGFIKPQKDGAHQVVIFTFIGALSSADAKAWNTEILALKQRFKNHLTGVTMKGDPTPQSLVVSKEK